MRGGVRDGTLAGEGARTMKSLWIPALMAVCSLAALATDASGTWKASVETPNGTMENTFTLKVEGDKLTGTIAMGQFGEAPISMVPVSLNHRHGAVRRSPHFGGQGGRG